MRINPVPAMADIDPKRHRQIHYSFHFLSYQPLGSREIGLRHLEDQLVVHLQDH